MIDFTYKNDVWIATRLVDDNPNVVETYICRDGTVLWFWDNGAPVNPAREQSLNHRLSGFLTVCQLKGINPRTGLPREETAEEAPQEDEENVSK